MENTKMSKKELKELKKIAELQEKTAKSRANLIKWLTISISSFLFIIFFGWIIVSSKQTAQQSLTNVSEGGHARGNDDAKVALVEFSDFQCPACKAAKPNVDRVLSEYKGKVKLVYKHFPLTSIHKNGVAAAVASEAAGKQEKFWEIHDVLFEKQDEWSVSDTPNDLFKKYAADLKLDEKAFSDALNSQELEKKVMQEEDEGVKNGVNATPTFFVNNRKVKYDTTYESLKKAVDEALRS